MNRTPISSHWPPTARRTLPHADADELAAARGDAAAEHASFTVDRDDPQRDEGGNLLPSAEPI